MAGAFALFASIAGFDTGNMAQANSIANALNAYFVIPEWLTEIVLVILVGAVLLCGIERISTVADKARADHGHRRHSRGNSSSGAKCRGDSHRL